MNPRWKVTTSEGSTYYVYAADKLQARTVFERGMTLAKDVTFTIEPSTGEIPTTLFEGRRAPGA